MSCICNSPVRPEFKDSYKDLLDKPSINGTVIDGNVETDNLGIKYPKLIDKPSINGVPLEGALTAEDLGIKAGAKFKIVTALPTADIDPLTIYLVPADVSGENNFYQEFIYINDTWEKIGEPISLDAQSSFTVVRGIYEIPIGTTNTVFLTSKDHFEDFFGYKLLNNSISISCVDLNFAGGLRFFNSNTDTPVELLVRDGFNLNNDEKFISIPAESEVTYTGLIYIVNDFVIMPGTFGDIVK